MELARLFVRIDGDTRGLDKSLDRTERRMEVAGHRAEGTALAFGAIGAGALAAAGGVTMAAAKFERLESALVNAAGSELEAARQLERLHEVAKRPGLGFEEALRGSVRLQAVDLSARLAERSVAAFGNAIASAGGTKDDLNGVIVALSQIASKGKVSAEELQQIAERVPQIRSAMQAAFGTSDTEVLQRRGVSPEEFIERIVAELEKLPPVADGAQNALENLGGGAERAAAAIGDQLLPVVTPTANALADIANAFADSDEAQRVMTDGVILLAGVLAGRMVGGATKAAAAKALQAREAYAAAQAERAQAGASLEAARAAEADAAATLHNLQATRQAILLSRHEASAVLAKANAYRAAASAVPIESLAPLGGAAVEREMARRAKAAEDVSRATRELATLGQQQARVDREIERAQMGVAAASGVVEARQQEVAVATTRASIASRAATVAMSGMRTVFMAMGGWVGIGITALTAFSLAVAARKREVEEFADSVRESLLSINGDVAGMTEEQLDAHIADLEKRFKNAEAGLVRFGNKMKEERKAGAVERSAPLTGISTIEGAVSEGTRNQVDQYTRDVLALGAALQEARKRREELDEASTGGGGSTTPAGAAALDGTLSTLRAVVEMQDDARENLRGLELELAFETQADRAEKLREKIAETTAQIEAMETAIKQMGGRAALQDPTLGLARGSQPRAPGDDFRWVAGVGKIANLQTHPGLSKLQETADTAADSLSGMEKATAVVEGTFLSVGDAVSDFFKNNLDPKLILSNLATSGVTFVLDQLFSGVADLFGESEAERRARQVRAKNTAALEQLTRGVARLGGLLRSTAGGDVAGVRAAAAAGVSVARGNDFYNNMKATRAFEAELQRLGLTFDDAKEIAAAYGIELTRSVDSLQAFVDAMDKVKLGELFAGAAGQMDLLERRFGLYDMGEQERLEARRQLFLDQVELDAATETRLGSFDLSTEEGRQGFEEALREIFEMAPNLSLGQLGGLSPDQFLEFLSGMDSANDALQELADSADEVNGSLRNVPTGFRYALAVFNASAAAPAPGSVTGYGTTGSRVDPAGVGGAQVIEINGPIHVHGVQDGKAMLAEVETQAVRKQRRGGVTIATEIR